ncbi:MAG: hypothetical protein FWC68_04820 [Oscillospiraceae bacterium]|nr:hypothetical protein [Oscillospiraceae bacterium]
MTLWKYIRSLFQKKKSEPEKPQGPIFELLDVDKFSSIFPPYELSEDEKLELEKSKSETLKKLRTHLDKELEKIKESSDSRVIQRNEITLGVIKLLDQMLLTRKDILAYRRIKEELDNYNTLYYERLPESVQFERIEKYAKDNDILSAYLELKAREDESQPNDTTEYNKSLSAVAKLASRIQVAPEALCIYLDLNELTRGAEELFPTVPQARAALASRRAQLIDIEKDDDYFLALYEQERELRKRFLEEYNIEITDYSRIAATKVNEVLTDKLNPTHYLSPFALEHLQKMQALKKDKVVEEGIYVDIHGQLEPCGLVEPKPEEIPNPEKPSTR